MSVKGTKKKSHTDWRRLRNMRDQDIELADIPPLNARFFKTAKLRLPQPKSLVTMRLDPDVIQWFKRVGKGYQTRINAVLRMYIETQSHS